MDSMPISGRITAGELTRVCSHYDLGQVTSARKLKRGSGQSPKVILESSTGAYLLKRRAPGRDDLSTVAVAHQVQLFLARHGFPTPPLIGTRRDNNSMLQVDGRVYEVFRFVEGVEFNRTAEQTYEAGKALAALHELLKNLAPNWKAVVGAYHAAIGVLQRLSRIPTVLGEPQSREHTRALRSLYRYAAEEAQRCATGWRPDQLIHADWHPGNMIFADPTLPDLSTGSGGSRGKEKEGGLGVGRSRVLAVLDFDSIRLAPPVVDVANAALQFSILRGVRAVKSENPREAPDEIDLTRFKALCQGYHQQSGQLLRPAEIMSLPWLMIEALITEAAVTIAATGKFGPVGGWDMLRLVLRKAQWIQSHAATMIDAAKHAV